MQVARPYRRLLAGLPTQVADVTEIIERAENAVKVMIENPLNNNRTLSGPEAYKLGIADAMFEPADFVEQSIAWAAQTASTSSGTVFCRGPAQSWSTSPPEQ